MQFMHKAITVTLLLSILTFGVVGCDLLDSSNVENPDLTEEAALNNPDPLQRWTNGLDRQIALALNGTIDYTSIATDNYANTESFFNQNADALQFTPLDNDIDNMFFRMNDLRESALFGKNTVLPADDDPDPDDIAELDFYLGISHILLGEHFLNPPLEGSGSPASPSDHFDRAVTALQAALNSGNGDQTGYKLALARAHYDSGNQADAIARAEEVLNEGPEYIRLVEFDPNVEFSNSAQDNEMQDALYDRPSLDDFQPLPRLDFLDPKYGTSANAETPVPLLKAEEAHLIIIEANLADNQLPSAQAQMKELIDLVEARGTREVDETAEGRRQESPEAPSEDLFRPDSSIVEVRASPQDPYRSGLVLNRTDSTMVASISGTSVTDAMVDAISSPQEAWELYYLMRQEIFMAEGRRFFDLGLKLPLPENEFLVNENVDEATASEQVIPSWIPDNPLDMDGFTYDIEAGQATCTVNMNRILANNRSQVSPFLSGGN